MIKNKLHLDLPVMDAADITPQKLKGMHKFTYKKLYEELGNLQNQYKESVFDKLSKLFKI